MTAVEPADAPASPSETRTQQVAALVITVGLIVLGAVLGLLWAWWSPERPPGARIPGGTVQINESEAFAAGDGRFGLITAVVGLLVGGLVWYRRSARGPWVAAALCFGGLAGSWVMGEVGHLVGGGTDGGPLYTETGHIIKHLPLSVHMTGLFAVEALLAVLVYSVLAAFAVEDDLGRPDPDREGALRRPDPQLVAPQYLVQYSGADGDGAGLAQEGELAPQDPAHGP